jgi:hypothetical protein
MSTEPKDQSTYCTPCVLMEGVQSRLVQLERTQQHIETQLWYSQCVDKLCTVDTVCLHAMYCRPCVYVPYSPSVLDNMKRKLFCLCKMERLNWRELMVAW